jgi:peroxiredoxin
MNWDPRAPKTGEQATDLLLLDEAGKPAALSSVARGRPVLALVFRGPDDEEGLRLLRDYRDVTLLLHKAGVSVCGIAPAEPSALAFMRSERGLGFPLLSDADGTGLARWGMAGRTGLFLIGADLKVKQRALGTGAPAATLLLFVRRGGARNRRRLRDRVAQGLRLLAHAVTPRRLAR